MSDRTAGASPPATGTVPVRISRSLPHGCGSRSEGFVIEARYRAAQVSRRADRRGAEGRVPVRRCRVGPPFLPRGSRKVRPGGVR
jgi:hypothetical protein